MSSIIKKGNKKLLASAIIISIIALILITFYISSSSSNDKHPNHKKEDTDRLQINHPQTINDVDDNDCQNFIIVSSINEKDITKGREIISKFFTELKRDGYTDIEIDKVAINTGISIFQGRQLRSEFSFKKNEVPYINSSSRLQLSNDSILTSSPDELLIIAESDRSLLKKAYRGKYHGVSLIGKIMEGQIANKERLIYDLLDLKPEIIFSDLVVATREGIPTTLVKNIFNSSNLNPKRNFGHELFIESLSTIALKFGHYELFLFWYYLGAELSPDIYSYNALDILANNIKLFQSHEIQEILSILRAEEVYSQSLKTRDTFKAYLPPETFNLFSTLFDKSPPPLKFDIVDIDKTKQLHQRLLMPYVKNNITDSCITKLGEKIAKAHFVNIKKQKAKTPFKDTNSFKVSPIVQQAIGDYSTSHEVEEYLASFSGIKGKRLIENYRLTLLNQLAESVEEYKSLNSDEFQHNEDTIERVLALAKKGEWQKALSLLNTITPPENEKVNLLIMLALSSGASFETVVYLLELGGTLPDNTIFTLIMKNDSEMAAKLIPYGLNTNFIDPLGYSALMLAIKYRKSNMFDFLLNLEGRTKAGTKGFDELDVALHNYPQQVNDLYYIRQLINMDYTINISHRERAKEIRESDLNAYFRLINISNNFIVN